MIKQFRGTYYYVSDDGKVYSNYRNNMKEMCRVKTKQGYLISSINIDNKRKLLLTHRMIAECFLSNYSNDLQVNHINFVKDDNRLENLEMVTNKENMEHAVKFRREHNLLKIKNEIELKKYMKDYYENKKRNK